MRTHIARIVAWAALRKKLCDPGESFAAFVWPSQAKNVTKAFCWEGRGRGCDVGRRHGPRLASDGCSEKAAARGNGN